jgi:hypothetical protein
MTVGILALAAGALAILILVPVAVYLFSRPGGDQ